MNSSRRAPGIARNAIANWVSFVVTALVGFFLSPFLVGHLGATQYGLWAFLAGITLYLGLLDIGIRQAVNRYVAHHRAIGEHDQCGAIVSTAIKLFLLLGIVTLFLSGAIALLAPRVFNIPDALVDDARIVIVLGGLTVAVSLIGGAFGGVLTGLQRFDVIAYIEISVLALRTIAIVIAIRSGYGLVMLASIQLVASILNGVGFRVAIRRLFADLDLRLRGLVLPQARMLLSFGASMSVIFLLGRLVSYSDSIIIAAILPIEAVTFFGIAGTLANYAKDATAALAYVLMPRVSALAATGSGRVKDEVLAVAGIGTLLTTPMAIVFVIQGESFISLWMGSAYGPTSGEILRILAFVVWLEAGRSIIINALVGVGKQRILIPGLAFEAICKIGLSFALAGRLGLPGVALGTLIPSVFVNLAYMPRCLSTATGVSVSLYLRRSLLLPTAACAPFALAIALIERYAPATSLWLFFVEVLLVLPLVPAAAWFVCLTDSEKLLARALVTRLVGR
ncbi:MAG TPA: oligosaccharide flippase family protein [Rhodocyclaceae bacterium]|nr:oligosaccharide flippase family protein [Rhodocyclaceae bacterium]